ncbi:N-acetylglucosamine-6-phosphate deacetylase, partial [Streptomyces fuscigenes]|uniref:N-acetylglucosamine-6-phosphate deacetylase n=1 Tax=Streptomyces fuscigenes TaxID=1528880 RepID=UPI001F2FD690
PAPDGGPAAPAGPPGACGPALLFTGGRFATADAGVARGWLLVRDGLIHSLGTGRPPQAPARVVDLGGRLVVPGFVDPHCHGGAGHSVYTGDPDDVRAAAAGHLARGTTTMLASIATVEPGAMEAAARAVASVIDDGSAPNLAGIHFEGPFLSPQRRGAQTRSALRAPEPDLLERLLRAAGGHAVSLTLAPELPGAVDLVRRYARSLVCSLGHTDADAARFARAVDLGARAVTHLFNAMPPLHHREPGPVAAALLDPRLVCELIVDGHHLADDTVRLAHRLAGPERLMLVSDAMPAAGMADGTYAFADREVSVEGGVARLRGTRTLAGSTLFVAQALRRAVSVVGLPLADAVRMSSGTAARLLGLRDRGELRPGLRADLVELDGELRPGRVWLRGQPVPGTPAA